MFGFRPQMRPVGNAVSVVAVKAGIMGATVAAIKMGVSMQDTAEAKDPGYLSHDGDRVGKMLE